MDFNMDNQNYKQYADFLETLGNAAAAVSLKYFRKPVEVVNKGPKLGSNFDPVTVADKETEQIIRDLIEKHFPDHNILGEEHVSVLDKKTDFTWVIDPIDGTRAFISGIPTWGTLIALHDGGKPFVGMLDQPYLKERFIGTPNGTTLNGDKIKCRPCPDISVATLSTTDPVKLFNEAEKKSYDKVASKANLNRNGFDCYAYAMVACGFIDAVIESGLEPYDIQALIPIIQGSGGIITNWQGNPCDQGGQVVACGDKQLHSQIINLLA